MSIHILDPNLLTKYLVAGWQHNLNTTEDPANGLWYTQNPPPDIVHSGGTGGLYGLLFDSVNPTLLFNTLEQSDTAFDAQVFYTDNASNLDGLNSQANTLHLSFQPSTTLTTSHTETDAVTTGFEIQGSIAFIVAGGTFKLTGNYQHTWQNSSQQSITLGEMFSVDLPVLVPPGKVYQGQIVGTLYTVTVPYHARILLQGTSETWFADQVNGHYNWQAPVGDVCNGVQPSMQGNPFIVSNGGDGGGFVDMHGTLSGQQSAQLTTRVIDITAAAQQHIMKTTVRPLTEADIAGLPVLDGEPVQTGEPVHA